MFFNRYGRLTVFLFILILLLVPGRSLYAKQTVSLEVQPVAEDKVWNTTTPRDQNPNGKTNTYYYPWKGDDSVQISGYRFINLTDQKADMIEKYGISISGNPATDIASAVTEMDFLGQHTVQITWNKDKDNKEKKPVLTVARPDLAEADGYGFSIKLRNAVCNVVDNGEVRITESDWDSYYNKAKESIRIILEWQEKKGSFGSKDNPCYGEEGADVFDVLAAARCGYNPYGDPGWFDRWFSNTKKYIEKMDSSELESMQSTSLAKLILAIEACGYDPRDIRGIDLLSIEGKRNVANMYRDSYAIFSLKAAGYSTDTFTDEEIETWIHNKAAAILRAKDTDFQNPDNSIGWQPLLYWYGKKDYEDVTEAVDYAVAKLSVFGQRATGGICTVGYEEACPMYANNAWNIAQILLFTGDCGYNVLKPESGFTKNGNNILDATFALMNYEDRTLPGFDIYDPSQLARGLDAFVRAYERDVLKKDTPPFWLFSDVEVPTKTVNDAILALDEASTDEEIRQVREAYNGLDEKYKSIFNTDYLQKLEYFESGERDAQVIDAAALIRAIPDPLTLADRAAVNKADKACADLNDDQRSRLGNKILSRLDIAKQEMKALEDQEAARLDEEKKKAEAEDLARENALRAGEIFVSGQNRYKVLNKSSVTYIGPKSRSTTKISIPATVIYKKKKLIVTTIAANACKGCKKLKKLVIGSKVTNIGSKAFYGDSKLKKIIIQSSVLKKVGANAFKGIYKKAVIKVPKKKKKAYKKLLKGKGQKKTVKIK